MTSKAPHSRPSRRVVALAATLAVGCAAPPPPPEVTPAVDVEERALVAEATTRLEGPLRIVFDWNAREVGGSRLSGAGVARAEPPYRARLDLFLDNNEAVARAALVDGDLRLPGGTPDDLLPPPHLLWGTLGVFRPGLDQTLLGGETVEGALRVRYRLEDGSEIHYRIAGGRVLGVERLRSGSVVQRVEMEYEEGESVPSTATYRDLAEGRELVLRRSSLERVEPFPPDIWGGLR